jgi:HEAT repeat protein
VASHRRDVAIAGHTGDVATARGALADADPGVRATALGALDRLGVLDDATVESAVGDPNPAVRRRAVELAARHPAVDLLDALDDPDAAVVEMAAWACGEREGGATGAVPRLVALAGDHADPLVRESAVAALGAIGDDAGLDAILAATRDKPAIRRRAVLALAPFLDARHARAAAVTAALADAAADRDWQVRQAVEDIAPQR